MRKEEKNVSLSEKQKEDFKHMRDEYVGMVYSLSMHYSDCNTFLADDATQHALIMLYKEMEKGTKIKNIKSYLHTIVKNYTLNEIKRLKKITLQEEVIPNGDGDTLNVSSAEEEYVEAVEKLQTRLMLEMILDELKEKNEVWYTIVVEVFHKGRGQLEVAGELGMSDTAMYATVRRIKEWSNKHKVRFEEQAMKAANEATKSRPTSKKKKDKQ